MAFDPDHTVKGKERKEKAEMWRKLANERTSEEIIDDMIKTLDDMNVRIQQMVDDYKKGRK